MQQKSFVQILDRFYIGFALRGNINFEALGNKPFAFLRNGSVENFDHIKDYTSLDLFCEIFLSIIMAETGLDAEEALSVGTRHFIDCICNNKQPLTDGHAGLNVVRILEASTLSMRDRGRMIEL
jgi:predicted dehydrogenase